MTEPSRALAGHVALVIGGGGVIGRAIVDRLCDGRAIVIVADLAAVLDQGTNEAVAGVVPCDVTDSLELERVFESVKAAQPRLDLLVNAAGLGHVAEIPEVSEADWRRVFDVNCLAPFQAMQHAVRLMRAQDVHPGTECRGKIVNISSSAVEVPITRSIAYGASKSALNYASNAVAVSCESDAISVTLVYPGNVDSELWRDVARGVAQLRGSSPDEFLQERLDALPTGRFQDPRDLAEMISFIAARRGMALNGKKLWTEAHVS